MVKVDENGCCEQAYHGGVLDRCRKMIAELQKAGFTKEQALRGLVFTGFHSVRQATFWLCSHTGDPLSMVDVLQDFFVLLCADEVCLVGGIQPSTSHLISQFLHFEACCTSVPEIHRILETASCSIQNWFTSCKLSLKFVAKTEPSFLGYELSDATGKTTLENLAKTLSVAFMQANVNVHLLSDQAKNHGPSHHLTLAQGFCPDLLPALTELHDQCLGRLASDPPSSTGWSVRLYSRDPRLRVPDPEVYEMLNTVEHDSLAESSSTWNPVCNSQSATHHSNGTSSSVAGYCVESHTRTCYHGCCIPIEGLVVSNGPDRPLLGTVESTSPKLPQVDTKLTLLTHQHGDHVLLLSSCTLPGRQGCPLGLNLSTGSTGVFNLRAGRRIPQYHTWTLHGDNLNLIIIKHVVTNIVKLLIQQGAYDEKEQLCVPVYFQLYNAHNCDTIKDDRSLRVYEMLNTVEHDSLAESSSTWNPVCNSQSATHHSNGTSSSVAGYCVESHTRTCYHGCCIPIEGLVVSNGPDRPLLGTVESTSPKLPQVDTKLTLLTHQHGDHVLLLSSCTLPGRQGCPLGLNLSTGSTGVFNLRAGRRIPQYHTWTLHGSIPIDPNSILLVRYRSRTNSQPVGLPRLFHLENKRKNSTVVISC
ncbi:hypothetical protein AHF37_03163 [Paragonimus kellicotti]|nr:hypothetical protein AHF37_03163 [Paragonimus kellicotti]